MYIVCTAVLLHGNEPCVQQVGYGESKVEALENTFSDGEIVEGILQFTAANWTEKETEIILSYFNCDFRGPDYEDWKKAFNITLSLYGLELAVFFNVV